MRNLASTFSALADPSRLRILNLLFKGGTLCVCDLQKVLGFTQTKVSRHMRYLRRTGLVVSRREGRWVYYTLVPGTGRTLALYRFLQDTLPEGRPSQVDGKKLLDEISAGTCVGVAACCEPETPKEHNS